MNVLFIVMSVGVVQFSNDVYYFQAASQDAIVIYNHDAMITEDVYIMTQPKNSTPKLENDTSKKKDGHLELKKELPET